MRNKKLLVISIIIGAVVLALGVSYLTFGRSFFVETQAKYYNHGDQLFKQKQYTKAIESLEKALAIGGDEDQTAKVYLKLGEIYELKGQFKKATEDYQKAIDTAPKNKDVILGISSFELRQGDYQTILDEEAKRTQESQPLLSESDEGSLILAKSYLGVGNIDPAITLLTSDNPETLYLKGLIQLAQKNPSEAKTILGQIKNKGEKSLRAKNEKVLGEMTNLEKQKNQVYYYALVGKLANDLKEPEVAQVAFSKALEFLPDYRDAWLGKAYAYFQRFRYSDAEGAIQSALKSDRVYGLTFYLLGRIQLAEGKLDQAGQSFSKAEKLKYQSADLYFRLGIASERRKDFTKAATYFAKGLKQDIKSTSNYNQLAYCDLVELNRTEQIDELISNTDQSLKLTLEGFKLWKEKQLKEATDKVNQVLRSDYGFALAYYVKALILRDQGHTQEAKESYARAIDLDLAGEFGNWRKIE